MRKEKYIKKVINNKREIYIPNKKTKVAERYFKNNFIDNNNTEALINIKENIKENSSLNIIKDLKETLKDDEYNYIVKTDIENFFSSINVEYLLTKAAPNILNEIAIKYLKELFLEDKIKTGSSLSIILGEIYLYEVFESLKEFKHYHYVDDILLLAKTKEMAEYILERLKEGLKERGLSLKEEKTFILEKTDKNNEFLGFNFYYYKAKDTVFVNIKKNTKNRIEKIYKRYYKRFLKYQDNTKKTDELIEEMNNYSFRLWNYYSAFNVDLNRNFYFINSIIKKIADEIGFVKEVKKDLEHEKIYKTAAPTKKGKRFKNKRYLYRKYDKIIYCLKDTMLFYEGNISEIILVKGYKTPNHISN